MYCNFSIAVYCNLNIAVYYLSIPLLGEGTSEDLARYFGSADKLLAFARRYAEGDAEAIAVVAPEKGSGAIEGLAKKRRRNKFVRKTPFLRPIIRKIFFKKLIINKLNLKIDHLLTDD